MSLYTIAENKLDLIKENEIKYTNTIKTITENNLKTLFNLKLIETNYPIEEFKNNTIAIEDNDKTLTAIIYNRNKKYNLNEIGKKYIKSLKNYKKTNYKNIKIIFLFQKYTTKEVKLIEPQLNIELWKIQKFNNNTILYDKITENNKRKYTLAETDTGENQYLETDHLHNKPYTIIKFYKKFKEKIQTEFNNVEIVPTKTYIAYRIKNKSKNEFVKKNIILVEIQNDSLKIWIGMKKGELNDPENITRDVSDNKHHKSDDYEIKLHPEDDLNYFMSLFKQSYKNQI